MKSFNQFLSESINISGDFNGNLYINNSEEQTQPVKESFFADVMWRGNLYRMEIEGSIMHKNELTEHLQNDYPGSIVHNIYPQTSSLISIKNSQRYHPSKLEWID